MELRRHRSKGTDSMVSSDHHQMGLLREGVTTTFRPAGGRLRTAGTRARTSIAAAAGDGCLTGPVALVTFSTAEGELGWGYCSPSL